MRRLTLGDDPGAVIAALRERGEPAAAVRHTVTEILDAVRARGDDAVRACVRRLDRVDLPERYGIDPAEIAAAWQAAEPELRAALELAAANIRAYHTRERPASWRETLAQGQVVGQEIVPLAVAGLYVPGGLANYPSSVLMTAIPAAVAGVERIVVCSPPRTGGGVAAGVAAACALLGIDDLYPIGGAQAVAAMAFGTTVVPRCDVIVGPGNAYVTEAKRQVMGEVRIDGLAGPSEVLIVADGEGRADWLAADLLGQAEHGAGAMAALLDVGGELGDRVADAVAQLSAELVLPTERIAIVACSDLAAALDLVNAFAPEHLELHVAGAAALLTRVRNAGAVFVGPRAATAFGDYAAGTNHVLPTGGSARFGQGLSVSDFVKRVGFVELSAQAATALAGPVATIAAEEGLRRTPAPSSCGAGGDHFAQRGGHDRRRGWGRGERASHHRRARTRRARHRRHVRRPLARAGRAPRPLRPDHRVWRPRPAPRPASRTSRPRSVAGFVRRSGCRRRHPRRRLRDHAVLRGARARGRRPLGPCLPRLRRRSGRRAHRRVRRRSGRALSGALVTAAGITLHVRLLSGSDPHHIVDAVFEGLGEALRTASETLA